MRWTRSVNAKMVSMKLAPPSWKMYMYPTIYGCEIFLYLQCLMIHPDKSYQHQHPFFRIASIQINPINKKSEKIYYVYKSAPKQRKNTSFAQLGNKTHTTNTNFWSSVWYQLSTPTPLSNHGTKHRRGWLGHRNDGSSKCLQRAVVGKCQVTWQKTLVWVFLKNPIEEVISKKKTWKRDVFCFRYCLVVCLVACLFVCFSWKETSLVAGASILELFH